MQIKKAEKQIFSIVLTVILLLGIVPVAGLSMAQPVYASNTPVRDLKDGPVALTYADGDCIITGTYNDIFYSDLMLNDGNSANRTVITTTVGYTGTITLRDVTIDLSGRDIYLNNHTGYAFGAIRLNGGTLKLEGENKIIGRPTSSISQLQVVDGDVTVESVGSGSLHIKQTCESSTAISSFRNTSLTLNANITAESTYRTLDCGGDLTVSGGHLSLTTSDGYALITSYGDVNFTGGKITTYGEIRLRANSMSDEFTYYINNEIEADGGSGGQYGIFANSGTLTFGPNARVTTRGGTAGGAFTHVGFRLGYNIDMIMEPGSELTTYSTPGTTHAFQADSKYTNITINGTLIADAASNTGYAHGIRLYGGFVDSFRVGPTGVVRARGSKGGFGILVSGDASFLSKDAGGKVYASPGKDAILQAGCVREIPREDPDIKEEDLYEEIAGFVDGPFENNASPVITTTSEMLPQAVVGVPYTAAVTALNSPASFALVDGTLPSGLTLNTATGEISGTPVAEGASTFRVTATNAFGTSEPVGLSIAVALKAIPVISITRQPQSLTTIASSEAATLSIDARTSDGSALSWQWYSATSLSDKGGTAISGETGMDFAVPTGLGTGVYYYFCKVSAVDAESVRSIMARVIVNPREPVVTPTEEPVVEWDFGGTGEGGGKDDYIQLDLYGVKIAYISVSLGYSAPIATGADVRVEGDAVTAAPKTLDTDGNVLVTAVEEGDATVFITFDGVNESYNKAVRFKVINSYVAPVYTIAAGAGPGGTISPSGNVTVAEGAEQTFTIVPDSGYYISQVLVDGVNVGAVSTYTFQDISGDHAISATFAYSGSYTGSDSSSGGSGGGAAYTASPLGVPVTVTSAMATDAARKAAASAKSDGATSATVNIKNPGNISLKALQAMAKAAGMPVRLQADSMNGGAVDVRITLDPSQSTRDLNLSASASGAVANARKAAFKKWFSNKLAVIHLGQQGSFGQPVQIAAKVDLTGMNTKNLYFYSYDSSTRTYRRIAAPNYRIDENGYLHFTTEYAGDIIISEGPLQKK